MPSKVKIVTIAAVLAMGLSSAAFARYPCGRGYALYNHHCRPIPVRGYSYPSPGYSNPVSGAVSGAQSGAATGYATGGPVGAAVGTALGTAGGTLTGTANMLTGH
jgi:hypothetical protein